MDKADKLSFLFIEKRMVNNLVDVELSDKDFEKELSAALRRFDDKDKMKRPLVFHGTFNPFGNRQHFTLVYTQDGRMGISLCSASDNFVKKDGRMIALIRASIADNTKGVLSFPSGAWKLKDFMKLCLDLELMNSEVVRKLFNI